MRFLVFLALIAVASAATMAQPSFDNKDMKCDFCMFVMKKIDESVFTEDNVDEALSKLDEICEKAEAVSPYLGNACEKFLDETVKPEIEDILAKKPTPEEACKQFEMC